MQWDKNPLHHLDMLLPQRQLDALQNGRDNLKQLGSTRQLDTFFKFLSVAVFL